MMQVQVRPKGADPFYRLHQSIVTQESAPEYVRRLVAAREGSDSDSRKLLPLGFVG
jgi:hypothetical protein